MAIHGNFVIVQRELFDSMRQHCESCNHFNIGLQDLSDGRVVCIPTDLSSDSEPGQQARKSRRSQAVDHFLQRTPKPIEWRKTQNELGLSTPQDYQNVIQGLTCRTYVERSCESRQDHGQSENELIEVGRILAKLIKSSLENAKLQRSFASFQVLILLSYCEFLRQKGISPEAIDELVQMFTGLRERDRKALLDTVPWINRLIVRLVRKGWSVYRVTELFFINAISISDLIRIRDEEDLQPIFEHLATDTFVTYEYRDCLAPSYSIPGLIAFLLDSGGLQTHNFALDEIYTILGYDLPDLPTSAHGIHQVRPAQVTPEFEVVTADSFGIDASLSSSDHRETEDHNTTTSLSSLIYAIGSIPEFMLEQAASPQRRWDRHGTEYQTDPQQARFSPHLKSLFLDYSKLWQVLQHLISLAVVEVEKSDNVEIYTCGSEPAESLYGHQSSYWIEQALWLFCYTFPRTPTALSVSKRGRLLSILDHLLQRYAETGLEIPSDDEIIETLLAASKFRSLNKRHQILSLIDRLLERSASIHLHAEAVYQRSVILRLKGDITGSNRLLQRFLDCSDMAVQLKSHSVLGLLHLSQATNYAYNSDFVSANEETRKWPLPSNATEKQLDVIWNQMHSVGRIFRGQGYFDAACQTFERCLDMQPLCESKRFLALSGLADTYIEIDYVQSMGFDYKGELLYRAENLVRPEIEHLRSRAPRSKGFRRLLLSLSEIEIRLARFDKAELLLVELCSIYEKLADPDIVDRLGHLRAFIALARLSPVSEAEIHWTEALNLGRRYYPFEEQVFIVALIHLFICTIRLQRGDVEEAKSAFDYAAAICCIKSRQFLIPGVGTYLFDYVQVMIESLVGWNLMGYNTCN